MSEIPEETGLATTAEEVATEPAPMTQADKVAMAMDIVGLRAHAAKAGSGSEAFRVLLAECDRLEAILAANR